MLVSYLFFLAFVAIKAHASLLRGGTSNETLREVAQSLDDTFDCYPYQLDGHSEPGTEIEAEWSCEFEGSETEPVKTYSFEGDFENTMKERFGDDILDIGGVLKLIVPRVAVVESSIMILNRGIDVIHDRRERKLAHLTGDHNVLIIRVVDNFGHSPTHWKSDLKRIFYQDDSNLKKRLEACSNGKLKIKPASATGPKASLLTHGVINIRLDLDVSSPNESWKTIGDKAFTKLAQLQGINLGYSVRILVMPDEVRFGGAAAYAQVGGNTIWVKDQYASYPIVQVHEFGHTLGQRHSGKDSSDYGDDSCYMGNRVPWNDHGAQMCFNAAKTYYFGWFSQWHKEVDPWKTPFNGNLVGIDDASKGRAGSSKVILKFSEGDDHYFGMFNRKKGINDEAIGGPNKVMITQQNARNLDSFHIAGLSPGEQKTIGNIVVKFCHVEYALNGDRARVLIYPKGQNLQCGTPPDNGAGGGGSCQDNLGWRDSYQKGCNWYNERQQRCSMFGDDAGGTGGKTAMQSCCVCGGGTSGSRNGNGFNGGSSSGVCTDDESWYDGGGSQYHCAWYKSNPSACELFGDSYPRDGKTANDICCACINR